MPKAGRSGQEDGAALDRNALWLLALAVAVSLAFALWPFQLRLPVEVVPNGAQVDGSGALSFPRPGIVIDRQAGADLTQRLGGGQAVTLAVAAEALTAAQEGPARLVSLSRDGFNRNLTLAEHLGGLVFRIRTARTGRNGIVHRLLAAGALHPGRLQLFVATYDGTRVRLFVDGRLAAEQALQAGPLAGWNPDHELVFGNEATGEHPWLGRIADVAVYEVALDPAQVAALTRVSLADPVPERIYSLTARCLDRPARQAADGGLDIGTCHIPAQMRIEESAPFLSPKAREVSDVFHHFVLLLPIGVLAGMVLARRPPAVALLAVGTWAFALEGVQAFVPARSSSALDLVAALVAGLAGCLAGRMVGARRLRVQPPPEGPP